MGIATSPALRHVRANQGITFRPQSVQSFDDTGLNTNEELDASETDITMGADASGDLSAGDIILIEEEFMLVTGVVTVTVSVERGHGSDAVTHTNPQDVFKVNTANTVLWLPGQDDPFSSTIRDRSGNGNDGALSNTTWLKNSKGLSYLDFDGADSLVTVSDVASIQNIWDGGGACLAWINPRSDGELDQGRIFDKRVGWMLQLRDEVGGLIKVSLLLDFDGAGDGQWRNTDAVLPINTWSLVGATYNSDAVGNNPTIFIGNNVYTIGSGLDEVTTPVGTRVSDATVDLMLGNTAGLSLTFDGGIQGSRLITTELTAAQFQGIYAQERGLFGV